MIDETKDFRSDTILQEIEREVASGFANDPLHFRPFRLYSWEAPKWG